MSQDGDFIAAGEGLEPHDSNPLSVQADVEKAMKKAQEDAEKAAESVEPEADKDEPIDFNKAKDDTTTLKEADQQAEEAAKEPEKEPDTDLPGDLQPPADWSADDQTIFRDCPGQVQQWLLDRFGAASAQAAEQMATVAPLQKMQAQWQPYVDRHGIPFDQAIDQVMRTEMLLRTGTQEQKRQTIQGLIQTYGVEFGQPQALPEELANDPVASALSPQLQQVMEGLNRLQSQVDDRFQNMQQSQEQQQQAALQAFADATDEKGQKLRPYFNEVKSLMEVLASQAQAAGTATTMDEVYQQACRASPTVWPKIQAAERSATLRERQKAAAEKKRASSSVSSSPSSGRNVEDKGKADESVYDTVLRSFNAHAGTP